MKQFPSIPHVEGFHGQPCIAFYKYDGSNLRFEWSKKRGWYKFGTRQRMFDKTDEVFGEAIDVFLNTYGSSLPEVFKKDKLFRNAQQVIAFVEFFGERSFAGQHIDGDPKKVVLIDVNIHKRGIISPHEFVESFGHLPVAQALYQGPLTPSFETAVRKGEIPNLNEGVICKGGSGHKLWMCKIKTDAYREKLKQVYADRWQEFWE